MWFNKLQACSRSQWYVHFSLTNCIKLKLGVGDGFSRNHPDSIDLCHVWFRCCLWSLPSLSLRRLRSTSESVILRNCTTHVPERSSLLRRSYRYQMFRCLDKVSWDELLIIYTIWLWCGGWRLLVWPFFLFFYALPWVSYLIITKSLMPNVVSSIYHNLTSPDTNPPEWALNGRIWISLFMLILVPLCFLRRLDSLRHASYVALFSVGKWSSFFYNFH